MLSPKSIVYKSCFCFFPPNFTILEGPGRFMTFWELAAVQQPTHQRKM